ncbi:MAG: hypothetical protein ACKOC5_02695 [Chloroflexota bacterium]
MRLTSKPLAAIVIAVLFGGIFFSSALGWWQTTSSKEAAVYAEGEFAGQANPADIRGSYTFGDVEKNFGIPAGLLAQAFGVQSDAPAAFAVKGLEEMYLDSPQEVGTASVRLFVAFYLGLPIDLSADIYLPEAAAQILGERSLGAEQAAYLETHRVPDLNHAGAAPAQPEAAQTPAPAASQPESAPLPAPAQPGDAALTPAHTPQVSPGTIRGKTTFAELIEWGLKPETIEAVIGLPLPPSLGLTVRDFCLQNGLDFETLRPALQAELDRLN